MYKGFVMIGAFFLLISNALVGQDSPKKCVDTVSPYNEIMRGKLTSQVRAAHNYFMNSTDTAAGRDYNQRTERFNKASTKTFQVFMTIRRDEYRKTVCSYYKTDWNKAGNSSWRTLKCQPEYYFLNESIKHTTNGDMKKGPKISSQKVRWKTGGHRRSETYVAIDAKYQEKSISSNIVNELNLARRDLNALGIPTELPPFLD